MGLHHISFLHPPPCSELFSLSITHPWFYPTIDRLLTLPVMFSLLSLMSFPGQDGFMLHSSFLAKTLVTLGSPIKLQLCYLKLSWVSTLPLQLGSRILQPSWAPSVSFLWKQNCREHKSFMHFPLYHPASILRFTEAEGDWEGTRIFFVLEYMLVSHPQPPKKSNIQTGTLWFLKTYNQNRLSFLFTLHESDCASELRFAEWMTVGRPESIY